MAAAANVWGRVTADYDWCETNYDVTNYIAEFWNTLSSVFIVVAGIFFHRRTIKYQYGLRFSLASFGVIFIGIGSILFHGTLQRWGQVLDEVPMLWSSLIFLWIGLCNAMPNRIEKKWSGAVACTLFVLGAFSTFIYFHTGGFLYFIITYILTVASIFAITLYQLRPNSPVRSYAIWSILMYSGGFLLLWLPEQIFCGNRITDSHVSGLLSLPIPLHAFFHVTSSIGPIYSLTYMTYEYLERRKRKPNIISEHAPEFICMINVSVVQCEQTSAV
jgi:dihydroceramidase